jgi:hypothetical protein
MAFMDVERGTRIDQPRKNKTTRGGESLAKRTTKPPPISIRRNGHVFDSPDDGKCVSL